MKLGAEDPRQLALEGARFDPEVNQQPASNDPLDLWQSHLCASRVTRVRAADDRFQLELAAKAPERGHSCPQHRPHIPDIPVRSNVRPMRVHEKDYNVRNMRTMLRTGMCALRGFCRELELKPVICGANAGHT